MITQNSDKGTTTVNAAVRQRAFGDVFRLQVFRQTAVDFTIARYRFTTPDLKNALGGDMADLST